MEFKEKALIEKLKEEEASELQQIKLKEKHGIEDENVVVVEKFSMTKFLIRTMILLVKTIISVVILALAAFGLIALLYDAPREETFTIIQNGFKTL